MKRFALLPRLIGFLMVEMATNLLPPVAWTDLQTMTSTGGVMQISSPLTNVAAFYRLRAQ